MLIIIVLNSVVLLHFGLLVSFYDEVVKFVQRWLVSKSRITSLLSTEVKQYEYWLRCNLALEVHVKKALLNVLHNRQNNPLYPGLPHDPQQLFTFLDNFFKQNANLKQFLTQKKIIRQDQWDILLPKTGQTDSSEWDITLIICIIVNCLKIKPTNGWDKKIAVGDNSIAANVLNARDLRNLLKHGNLVDLKSQKQFGNMWKKIKDILTGLQYQDMVKFHDLENDDLLTDYVEEARKIFGKKLEELKDELSQEVDEKIKAAVKTEFDFITKLMNNFDDRVKKNERSSCYSGSESTTECVVNVNSLESIIIDVHSAQEKQDLAQQAMVSDIDDMQRAQDQAKRSIALLDMNFQASQKKQEHAEQDLESIIRDVNAAQEKQDTDKQAIVSTIKDMQGVQEKAQQAIKSTINFCQSYQEKQEMAQQVLEFSIKEIQAAQDEQVIALQAVDTSIKSFQQNQERKTEDITIKLGEIYHEVEKLKQRDVFSFLKASLLLPNDKFDEQLANPEISPDIKCVMMLTKGYVKDWGRAVIVCILIDEIQSNQDYEECEITDCIEAGINCNGIEECRKYLQCECPICYGTYPMRKIVTSTTCGCKLCQVCHLQWLKMIITSGGIQNVECSCCQTNVDVAKLENMINHYVSDGLLEEKVLKIFENKMFDLSMSINPSFRYCAHCNHGFVWQKPDIKMLCDECGRTSCFKCQAPWSQDHDGKTCEEFAMITMMNESKTEKRDVAAQLEETFLRCPACQLKFQLARGGCMHMTCVNCRFGFCIGCLKEINQRTKDCDKDCSNRGLHAHHPRYCYYYMRDQPINFFQKLLQFNDVPYEKKVKKWFTFNRSILCNVKEQIQNKQGRHEDIQCGKEIVPDQAGVCEKHYKEYLALMINRHGLDPLDIYEEEDILLLLKRHNKEVPIQYKGEKDGRYLERLRQIAKTDIPLFERRKVMPRPRKITELLLKAFK